jgi:phosphoribosylamine--glycine ligase
MGDPEAQVVLPRLKTDLLDIVLATINGRLSECLIEWSPDPWVGVVLASEGYPGAYETGLDVSRVPPNTEDSVVFHAGTRVHEGKTITSGGRVLTATARGDDISDARRRAYELADEIEFANSYYRTDIAASI